MRMYDYDVAKPSELLTAENTVDGIENLKGSLLGRTFVDKIAPRPEASETANAASEAVDAVQLTEPVAAGRASRLAHTRATRAKH